MPQNTEDPISSSFISIKFETYFTVHFSNKLTDIWSTLYIKVMYTNTMAVSTDVKIGDCILLYFSEAINLMIYLDVFPVASLCYTLNKIFFYEKCGFV
jgi:hypothetical protein